MRLSSQQLSELMGEGLTIPEVDRQYPRILHLGDSGIGVKTLQYYLAFLGFFLPELPSIAITGVFDQETRDAVYTFQQQYGPTAPVSSKPSFFCGRYRGPRHLAGHSAGL